MPGWFRPGQLTAALLAVLVSVWLAWWIAELIVLTVAVALFGSVLLRDRFELRAERRETARLRRVIDGAGLSIRDGEGASQPRPPGLLSSVLRRAP